MFVLRLHNKDMKWNDSTLLAIGVEVSIKLGQEQNGIKPVFKGEITALELNASNDGKPTLTVRGYDRLHRLQRGRKTEVYLQKTDSDIVSQIAMSAGMSAQIEGGTGILHDYFLQDNQTDLEFLQQRARRLGLELVADDKRLLMQKRTMTRSQTATIEWGQNLLHFNCRVSAEDQVSEVVVRGWDVKKKEAIVGKVSKPDNHPSSTLGSTGPTMGNKFGAAKTASVYWPVETQEEAQKVAQAILDDLDGRLMQMEGSCFGEASIKPGYPIEMKGLGRNYSGKYYVTSCLHHYSGKGYTTHFEANGRQANTFAELISQTNPVSQGVGGTVVGIVTKNTGPNKEIGQIQVRFPWLGENVISAYARLVSPMTGNDRGFLFLPEINDEVLLAFEQGDVNRPYVLGAVWNGKDIAPEKSDKLVSSDGKINQRMLKTRVGHTLLFDDSPDKPAISIIDKTGKNKITIDSTTGTITIENDMGDVVLKAPKGKISLESMTLEIKAETSAKLNTTNLEMDAKASAKMSGATIEVSGKGSAKVTAPTTEIDGTAMVQIKGGIVKLN